MKRTIFLCIILSLPRLALSQQLADTTYEPLIPKPEYAAGTGSIVFIDEGHNNFHTMNGRFRAFSNLLERDGYIVMGYKGDFEKDKLSKGKILVISNALNENAEDYVIPSPSAFTPSEIDIIKQWVSEGGSLFLIADHMPFGDASKDLASVFGFEFTNGFVFEINTDGTISRGPAIFTLREKTLNDCIITKGRDTTERVEQVATFTGQAFRLPDDATSILTFNRDYINLLPDTAWVFDENTVNIDVKGWSQGAYRKYGKGRIVVFGEAAMFTAQLAGPGRIKVGMNHDLAPENYRLLLNIIHWLDGKL